MQTQTEPEKIQYANFSIPELVKRITKRGRRLARSPGHGPVLPNNGAPQQLTDVRFMSRPQREAFATGVEIWV